ncbi:hypothetical protein QUF80_10815 [Desulfococcaceae bacterium HSG8]|nr:hypothetical protein [Desulfococcaceae bacterium HSG8]
MAKFLDTTGCSYHFQQLVNNANEKLILLTPLLKISGEIRQSLEDKDRLRIDIRIIHGKNELQQKEDDWLRSLQSVRLNFCENLHVRCCLNENEAIITSMNFYEFSQVNHEMGMYVSRTEEPELYQDIYDETMKLARVSNNRLAKFVIRNAYTAAMAFFCENPYGSIDVNKLESVGLLISEGVKFTIVQPDQHNLLMTASHVNGDKIYSTGRKENGNITSEPGT